jgi:photosystem II stability/assembly factor-like uncharacterized protein
MNTLIHIFLFMAGCALLLPACRREEVHLPTFTEVKLEVPGDPRSVWFISPQEGFIAGGRVYRDGFLLSTSDGGRSWQTDTLLGNRLECVRFDALGHGYACGMSGLALYRQAGQRHWIPFRVDWDWYRAGHFVDGTHGVVVGGENFFIGFARRFGPAAFWQADTLQPVAQELADVWFSDSLTVHACGMGWVTRSTDGGRTWERRDATGDFFQSVHFPTPDTGYICGHSGSLLKTTDGGASWQTLRDGSSLWVSDQPFRDLYFPTAMRGYAVGDDGLFWRTLNGGADWSPVAGAPADAHFTGVFARGDRGWAIAAGGRVFLFEEKL